MQEYKNEINKKSMLENQQNQREEKMTKYKHLGFGFDGDAGHDILITDNLTQEIKVNKGHRHFSQGPALFGIDYLHGHVSSVKKSKKIDRKTNDSNLPRGSINKKF